jgi:hypothetical protein
MISSRCLKNAFTTGIIPAQSNAVSGSFPVCNPKMLSQNSLRRPLGRLVLELDVCAPFLRHDRLSDLLLIGPTMAYVFSSVK